MNQTPQVVLISGQCGQEIRGFLADYLHEAGAGLVLFARSFEVQAMTMYVALDVVPRADSGPEVARKAMAIRLPAHIVLASADATDQQKTVFGFAS